MPPVVDAASARNAEKVARAAAAAGATYAYAAVYDAADAAAYAAAYAAADAAVYDAADAQKHLLPLILELCAMGRTEPKACKTKEQVIEALETCKFGVSV